jgi:hypothetical protein
MHQPPTDTLLEALTDLHHHLAAVPEDAQPGAYETWSRLVDSLTLLFAAPTTLEVTAEHRATATALVTAYLEQDQEHALLAGTLADVDRAGLGVPEERIGVMAALVQLCVDALVAAVAASADTESVAAATPAELHGACRTLLQRIVIAHRDLA